MLEEKMIMKSGMMKQILAITLAALTEVSGVTAMLPAVAVYAEEATTEADAENLEKAAGEAADAEETETEQTPEIELEVGDATVVLKNETGADVTVEFVEEDAEAETEEVEAGAEDVEAAAEDAGAGAEDADAAAEDAGAGAEDVEAAEEDAEAGAEDADVAAEDAEANSSEAISGYLLLTDEDGEQHIFEGVDFLAVTDLVLTVEDDVFYLNYLDENMEECAIAESLDEEKRGMTDEDGQESASEAGQESADEAGQEENAKQGAAAAEQSAADAAAAAAEAAVRAAAEAAASGGEGERTEVSRQKYDDCDGSGHGYYEITYSDGSTEIEEY